MRSAPIVIEHLNHAFGEDELRRQILFDINAELEAGEIVILTGPSGSGKTTLLTLIGALRSAQDGSLRVLDRELRGASEGTLQQVRKRIGYIFQAHNLLDALTARQNVRLSLELHPDVSAEERQRRVADALESVGLADRMDHFPRQLSGGERQRVAIARALVAEPRILLADEPTASLDKQTGRVVVELIRDLARSRGVTVLLVTHDNRILDVADRILGLEDGRLSSFLSAVASSTHTLITTLASDIRKGALVRRIEPMNEDQLTEVLNQVTTETQWLLDVTQLTQGEAVEAMLQQVLEAFQLKAGELLEAETGTLLLVDDEKQELWSLHRCEHDELIEHRIPIDDSLAGQALTTGESLNVPDVTRETRFDPSIEGEGSLPVRNLLYVPLKDSYDHVFAVARVVNKRGEGAFAPEDEQRLVAFTRSLAVLFEAWWRMGCACRAGTVGRTPVCCGASWLRPPQDDGKARHEHPPGEAKGR